ncbi:MAG: tRNA (adenosine(37)-N6)-threonylcarbamoyltransferase complex ATPase subunit type 1 TsaE [Nakamurella sp.]
MTDTLELPTPTATDAFGRRLGAMLHAGDVVLLAGDLGAGKTALTKGIAAGMRIPDLITSPTFVIARSHRATPPHPGLIHVDAYRLDGRLELDDLDLDTDLARSAVVVEWGVGVAEQLAEDHLLIELERHPDDTRTATLRPRGTDWASRVAFLLGPHPI